MTTISKERWSIASGGKLVAARTQVWISDVEEHYKHVKESRHLCKPRIGVVRATNLSSTEPNSRFVGVMCRCPWSWGGPCPSTSARG